MRIVASRQSTACLAHRQRGTALVAGLVFLVVLILLGLSASSAAIQQEIIVRNIRDENLAVQAAEAALRTAETWIRNNSGPVPTTISGMIGGHTAIHDSRVVPFCDGATTCEHGDAAWWTLNAVSLTADLTTPLFPDPDIAEQPAYVIELIHLTPPGLGVNSNTPPTRAYRITARGVGANSKTVRIVRSVYRFG
jgi:type IV pilus assembly protein PilX